MEPVKAKTSHNMTSLDKWTAWCSSCHQGDLSATPEKYEAFATHLYEEALSSRLLLPKRHYQNSVSSVFTKLLKKHGYAEVDYEFRTDQHVQRGKELDSLNKDRVGQ
ncbi:hypothetical protein ABBQ32_004249 [Trebouxia sp. C0010 RCD-2024]